MDSATVAYEIVEQLVMVHVLRSIAALAVEVFLIRRISQFRMDLFLGRLPCGGGRWSQ